MYIEQHGRPDSEVLEAVAFSDGAIKGLIDRLDTIGSASQTKRGDGITGPR